MNRFSAATLFPPPPPSILYLWRFLPISIFFNLRKLIYASNVVILSFYSAANTSNVRHGFYTAALSCNSFIDNFCLTFTPLCAFSQRACWGRLTGKHNVHIPKQKLQGVCSEGPPSGQRLSRPKAEVCSAFQCCAGGLSSERRHMFSLAAPLSASVWAAVKRRCTHVENPGSRHRGLCYSSCPQWASRDVYSVCFSMEFCLSAVYIQHRLFFSGWCVFRYFIYKAFSVAIFIYKMWMQM